MIKVGIVGCGTIGKELALACQKRFSDQVTLEALADTDVSHMRKLQHILNPKPKLLTMDRLFRQCDLVIEAASKHASYEIAKKALAMGKDVMIMSVGGILGKEKEIFELARTHRCCLYFPSGGVVGIDGLKAAAIGKIYRVTLTTRKPPHGFEDAPHVIKHGIPLKNLKQEKVLFEGNAVSAVRGFPKNINVSATLSLAGLGARKTRVRIIASPHMLVNVHEVYVQGDFGSFYTRTENFPSEQNPKTSRLAILSAVATLERILRNVKIGT
ncbi:MAG: aspartate dehydrogenase [Candidatus Omnitrophica bacterium CG07_land_8_20_14_0_80_50_8]|nr:MAG: aspartate dehydrogenase [Candidatus Omnitrophica bacterium CG07_land_8_20_14_0_80_50_8]